MGNFRWLSGVFSLPFILPCFHTGPDFFSGLIGSLGYWLEQHPVERGSQPLYYYLLIQIPVYEFLPAFGAVIGLYYGFRHKSFKHESTETSSDELNYKNTFSLLAFWSIACFVAFTVAGERMPWLTYHIALPMIFLGGWGFGQLVERTDWQGLKQRHVFIAVSSMLIFVLGALSVLFIVLGGNPPCRVKTWNNFKPQAFFSFRYSGWSWRCRSLVFFSRAGNSPTFSGLAYSLLLTVFFALTISTSLRANFRTYGEGTEYLVYAHGADGIKDMLSQD